jgi:imidazolonepropionase-like amidohydrolase
MTSGSSASIPDGTVLPGLIDTHVHLCGDSWMGALDRLAGYNDAELADVITAGLRTQLGRYAVLEWRDSMRDGAYPTMVAAGPPITSRQGHCWNMGGEAAGPAELRAAVRERADRGVDVVKIMASGGFVTPGTDVMRCQFDLDDMRLIVDEAHAAGLPVTVHAHGLPAVEQAILAGADGIEHCSCMTPNGIEMSDHLVEALAARRIAVCPTLGVRGELTPPPAVAALMERTGVTLETRRRRVAQPARRRRARRVRRRLWHRHA